VDDCGYHAVGVPTTFRRKTDPSASLEAAPARFSPDGAVRGEESRAAFVCAMAVVEYNKDGPPSAAANVRADKLEAALITA